MYTDGWHYMGKALHQSCCSKKKKKEPEWKPCIIVWFPIQLLIVCIENICLIHFSIYLSSQVSVVCYILIFLKIKICSLDIVCLSFFKLLRTYGGISPPCFEEDSPSHLFSNALWCYLLFFFIEEMQWHFLSSTKQ